MNIAKSTYAGPAPQSATHWFVETRDGMTQIIEQVTADGRKLRSEVTVKLDGKDYPVQGDAQRDSTRASADRSGGTDRKSTRLNSSHIL